MSDAFTTGKEELVACLEIGKHLTSTRDFKKILEHIVTKGSELIKADHWSLLLKDEDSEDLSFVIVTGTDMDLFKPVKLGPGEGIAPHVASTGIPMFIPDVSDEPLFNKAIDKQTGFTTRSVACIPLAHNGTVTGVIEIVNIEDMNFFGAQNYPILSILADYAAIAIENSRYASKIEKMNITDEYTGLYNTRYLHQILDNFFINNNDSDNIAAIFIDIDNFKEVVDRFGHLDGSDVLRQIGKTISDVISGNDALIKYGGDEYVIILPGKNTAGAVNTAKQIANAVNESDYNVSGTEKVQVTASFGIASAPENATNKTDLLIAADSALFSIKKTTKNSIGTA